MKRKNNITYKLVHGFVFMLTLGFLLSACKKHKPEESFVKVYHDQEANKNYFPLSIKPTNDKGYLILSAYNGWNIQLVKTDQEGNLLWKLDLPSKYVNATPNLIERNGDLYFVCMDAVGLFTYVMKVDEDGKTVTEFKDFPQIQYPLYVHDQGSVVYIQNYNRTIFETGIFELSGGMNQIQKAGSLPILTDVENKIVDHINYTGKRFPFSIKVTPEKDYIVLSGFNNYSFSTVFLDPNLDFSGVYNGAAFDGGLNAIMPLGGNKFSLARFSFSNLFFNPVATLSPTAIDIAETIPAQGKAELDPQSPVLIQQISIGGSSYVVYLASTKSNQLLLSFYRKGSSELKGIKYLGQSVPLKACDFIKTSEEGLMLLSQVTVMGSFNRIATIKLSKEELEEMVK